MNDLYPYQTEAVERIRDSLEPSYLAFEMGLGKTRVALAVARLSKVRRLLVICPAVGRQVWVQEIARVWPDAPPVVVIRSFNDIQRLKDDCIGILSYGLVSQSKNGGYDYVAGLKKLYAHHGFGMTVLDEAHALKNSSAIRTKSILQRMHAFLGWVLPMSGTPAPNHAGELYPMIKALWPHLITNPDKTIWSQMQFEEHYTKKEQRYLADRTIEVIVGSRNVEELRAKLEPYLIRVRKKDVLKQLPDINFDLWPITPTGKLAGWTKIIPQGASDDEVLKILKSMDAPIATVRQATGVSKVEGSSEAIIEVLDNTTRKVVVFAYHQAVIDQLMVSLMGYGPVKLDGRDNSASRLASVDGFLNDPSKRVFIGQLTAAGSSITLVGPKFEVSDVFIVEPSTNPADNIQAAARIHRIGQKDAVQVWFMTASETFDDRVNAILLKRTQDFEMLFDWQV